MTEIKSNVIKGKMIAGSFLIFLGLFFILDNYNILNYNVSHYLFRWETFLIAIGVILIISKSNISTGFLLVLFGGSFIALETFDYRFTKFIFNYWPILVILFGFYILYKKSENKKIEDPDEIKDDQINSVKNDIPNLYKTIIFSDESINITNPKFSFCQCFLLFSSLKLFFNEEQSNKSILMNNSVFLSSLTIRVPKGWRVIDNTTNLLGETKDARENIDKNSENQVTVLLKGTNFFGSIIIKEI